jgi:hypothetical protein
VAAAVSARSQLDVGDGVPADGVGVAVGVGNVVGDVVGEVVGDGS